MVRARHIFGIISMAIIAGLAPNNSTSNGAGWNHTFVDRSVALSNGQSVTQFEVYSTTPRTFGIKIVREVSSSSFDIVYSQTMQHAGAGWQAATLAYNVPAAGIYRMAVYTPSDTSTSIVGSRATRVGDATGIAQGGFYPMSAQVPPMRVTIGSAMPPSDPPPPPSGSHYVVLLMGQSNMLNFGNDESAKSAFRSTMQAAMGNTRDVVFLNTASGGSVISAWAPGSAFYNAAVAAWNTAMAQPGAIPGAVIWMQGEADSGNCSSAIKWDVSLKTIFSAVRAAVGQPGLPAVATELFVNPDPVGRPYWDVLQRHQREVGALNVAVSAADLPGSAADPLHLASAQLVTLGQRYATALASRMAP